MSIDTYPGICEREAIAASALNLEGHVLEARDVRVHIRGGEGRRRRRPDAAPGRDPRPDRPQRRGQDDARQRALRLPARHERTRRAERRGHHDVGARRDRARRRRAHVPERAAVRGPHRLRERRGRGRLRRAVAATGSRAQLGDPRAPATSRTERARWPPACPTARQRRLAIARALAARPDLPPARRAGRRARRGRVGCARGAPSPASGTRSASACS